MTSPTYTLDHVRAALDLSDADAVRVRDYVVPPVVSAELQLARECAAQAAIAVAAGQSVAVAA